MMSNTRFPKENCLSDEDIYLYVSGQASSETLGQMEGHLIQCPACRHHVAEVLEILHPEGEQAMGNMPALSKAENGSDTCQGRGNSPKGRARTQRPLYRFRWPLAAAASIAIVAMTLWGLKNFYEIKKSEAFYSQAATILNETYIDASPNNLRLDLPFHSSFHKPEYCKPGILPPGRNLFYQALAFRESMTDAHLGLGSIYLRESKFDRAREEFQKVLAIKKGNVKALIGAGCSI